MFANLSELEALRGSWIRTELLLYLKQLRVRVPKVLYVRNQALIRYLLPISSPNCKPQMITSLCNTLSHLHLGR